LRLSNAILNRIDAGDMRPGDKLPLEGMLAGALAMYLAATGSLGMVWEIFGRTYRRQPASYQRVYLPVGHRPIEITSSV